MMIDCHLHLQLPPLAVRTGELIKTAKSKGAAAFWCNSTSCDDFQAVAELALLYGEIVPFFGIHPFSVVDSPADWRDRLESFLEKFPAAGLGEAGLDCWFKKCKDTLETQKTFLAEQIELANRLDRPVVLHSLNADGAIMELLLKHTPRRPFMMHAFRGSPEMVSRLAARGAYFSFAGNILNPQAKKVRHAVAQVPHNRLLIETDSPELKVFELDYPTLPEYLGLIRDEVAAIRNIPAEEVERLTFKNAERFLTGH
ncbi:MAG: TatD family hydrolase [Candidatus Izemoplasmatales bacterium]|nr:TatD family hydrolase [Candidatus Izemoplasmatales bacterium]